MLDTLLCNISLAFSDMDTSLSTTFCSPPLSPKEVDIFGRTNQTISPESISIHSPQLTPNSSESYRDKLTKTDHSTGTHLHTFTHQPLPLYTNHLMDEIINPKEGSAFVPISSDDKKCIYQRWVKVLIVKVYGKTVGYNFLKRKLHNLWKPSEDLNIIDLGKDSFLIDFKHCENYSKAIHGGLWFIGGHFIAIRQWEPAFKPSSATFSFTALWIELPGLPSEFYDH